MVIITKERVGLILIGLFFFSCIPLFLGHESSLVYSKFNYLGCQLLLILAAFSFRDIRRNKFLMSPSFLAVSYLNLNCFFGSIAFDNGLVFDFLKETYVTWSNNNWVLLYFNLANYAIILSYFLLPKARLNKRNIRLFFDLKRVRPSLLLLMGILLIVFFLFVELDFSFIGGDGSFSMVPKSLGAILLLTIVFRYVSLRKKIWGYLIILVFFSVFSWEDKRNAIFLLLPIGILEGTMSVLTLSIKRVILLLFSMVMVIYLILIMSIARGYGGYKTEGVLDAAGYVMDYIQSDTFAPSFMNNLEISYTYLHSSNAIESILKNPDEITYGETLIKPVFMFVPRHIYPSKPRSIIHHYTSSYSKEYRNLGGSWTISIQSEMFWNFHFFGIFFCGLVFLIFNTVYLRLWNLINWGEALNIIPLLFYYESLLILFRGSGFDMFLIFNVLSFMFFIAIQITFKFLYHASFKAQR